MTSERILDWRPRFDERSRQFAIRGLVSTPPKRRNKLWRTPAMPLDQLNEGACVTHGWTHEALSSPVIVDFSRLKFKDSPRDPQQFAFWGYNEAKKIDEWEGENYEGTSVLAGAKLMQKVGVVKEYRWAFNIEEVIDAVLSKGPVVIGINWYDGMYETQGDYLRVWGNLAGGHCLLVVGYKIEDGQEYLILLNSWGPGWGKNGLAKIAKADLARLLIEEGGEACIATRRSYGRG